MHTYKVHLPSDHYWLRNLLRFPVQATSTSVLNGSKATDADWTLTVPSLCEVRLDLYYLAVYRVQYRSFIQEWSRQPESVKWMAAKRGVVSKSSSVIFQ